MDLVAMLPWWMGMALAIGSYVLLSSVANRPVQPPPPGVPVTGMVTSALIQALAGVGQYVLPLLCLAGAGMSAYGRRRRQRLLASASSGASAVDGMRWQEFELLVGEAFRRQGYVVLELGGGGADGGVDLVLSRPSESGQEKTLVQCKHWRAFKVGVDVVRELYGVMAARGAAAGIVVTSGSFTAEAEAFAQGRNLRLIDGPALKELLRSAEPGTPPRRTPNAMASTRAAVAEPACPQCGKTMIRRTARRGVQSGSTFWGCSGYPVCRGTRPMAPR